jgi:O-antigen/teichoic acid export membrane protein
MSNLRRDFVYKFLTNLFRIPVSFILQAVFPRLLGPEVYGIYDFLTDSATKIITFFETGTSIFFFTNLSQGNKNTKLVRFYWFLSLIIALIYITFVLLTGVFDIYDKIWPKQEFYFIFLGAIWGIVTYFTNTTLKMLDAYNLTVKTEKFRIFQLFISVIIFASFYSLLGNIELSFFFYSQIFLLLVLLCGSIYLLRISGYEVFPRAKLTQKDIKKYKKSLWIFSAPLFIYSLFGLLAGFSDRWILQQFGGSIQQAYFGLSFKIGSFVFLVASAMMPLLMREFSKLYGNKDYENLKVIYKTNIKILYFIGAFLAISVSLNASYITNIFGGKDFEGATKVLSVMAFYPIHQSIGQINGTFYFSTERTREYRNIGMIVIPLGLILNYFFIAPASSFGLNLGALGLAYQMIITQLLSVNIMLFLNCRYLKIEYRPLLLFQFAILISLAIIGSLVKFLLAYLNLIYFANTLLFFIIFSFFAVISIYFMPSIIGFKNRTELFDLIKFKLL